MSDYCCFQHILNGEIYPTDDRLIVVSSAAFEKPDPSKGQYFYHRQVNSTRDKDYLSCLLGGVSIAEAYVFTWVNFAVEDFPGVVRCGIDLREIRDNKVSF